MKNNYKEDMDMTDNEILEMLYEIFNV